MRKSRKDGKKKRKRRKKRKRGKGRERIYFGIRSTPVLPQ